MYKKMALAAHPIKACFKTCVVQICAFSYSSMVWNDQVKKTIRELNCLKGMGWFSGLKRSICLNPFEILVNINFDIYG